MLNMIKRFLRSGNEDTKSTFDNLMININPAYCANSCLTNVALIHLMVNLIVTLKSFLFVSVFDATNTLAMNTNWNRKWLILLGDPYQPNENRIFLQILIFVWFLDGLIMTYLDIQRRNCKNIHDWSKQMSELVDEKRHKFDSQKHQLSYQQFVDVKNKFSLLINACKFIALNAAICNVLNMINTTLTNPDYLKYHLIWILIHVYSATFVSLRLFCYPLVFLHTCYTFNCKLKYILSHIKQKQSTDVCLITEPRMNLVKELTILYRNMIKCNYFWKTNIGLSHLMSFALCSYILYPTCFVETNFSALLILTIWSSFCFIWFWIPYFITSYINYKVIKEN